MDTKNLLDPGELVTRIIVPKKEGYESAYRKFRLRDSVDFAVIAVAASYKKTGNVIDDINLVFGAVAPVSVRAYEVEEYLKGKELTDAVIAEASELAIKNTLLLSRNKYKIQTLKAEVGGSLKSI